ncbi:putative cupin-like domain protein [Rosellinia necatrix]|uniref:Putative cupin-like domain protein n=1 Tax=Rosellinia necatrix TaxID=77044 RepID=A0A1S8ABL5_ROSNE|nr:putative cupin-like domain protein [Rosellinia necatrix]
MNQTSATITPRLEEWAQYSEWSYSGDVNGTWILCFWCHITGFGTHPEYGILFSDIVSQTGRAANALLSLHTALAWTVHYSYLGSYNLLHEAHIASTVIVRAPSKCTDGGCEGLVAVVTLIVFHLLCVAVITVLYVTQIRHSRYGNIWHAVSQLVNDEMREVLEAANAASDEDAFGDERKGDGDDFVKLVKLGDGRIEIRTHHV